eukprot:TRINITY_DN25435_c0_g1_i1.p1 TRINITY_DN25435_c0_g1~~TRINITY_DN25435_c0_g1_i1.p1  ORF type:complete len:1034 (+),score=171.03 TRINITY_DN25435_c0_g1_i1:1960-5061(+)
MFGDLLQAGMAADAPYGTMQSHARPDAAPPPPSVWALSTRPRLHTFGGAVGEPADDVCLTARTALATAISLRKRRLLGALVRSGCADVWFDGWNGSRVWRDTDGRSIHAIEAAALEGWADGVSLLGEELPDAITRRETRFAKAPETVLVLHCALKSEDPSTISAALLLEDTFVGWAPGGMTFARPVGLPPVPHNSIAAAIAVGDLEAVAALLETDPGLATAPCLAVALHSRAALIASPLWYAAYTGSADMVELLAAEECGALTAAGDGAPGLWYVTPAKGDVATDYTDGLTCSAECHFLSAGAERVAVSSCIGAGLAPGSDLLQLPSPVGKLGGWDVHSGRVECMRSLLVRVLSPATGVRSKQTLDFFSCGFAPQRRVRVKRPADGKARSRVWPGSAQCARPHGLYTTVHLAALTGDAALALLAAGGVRTVGPSHLVYTDPAEGEFLCSRENKAPALQGWEGEAADRVSLMRLWCERVRGDLSVRGLRSILRPAYVRWVAEEPSEVLDVAVRCTRRGRTALLRVVMDALADAGENDLATRLMEHCFPQCLRLGNPSLLGILLARMSPTMSVPVLEAAVAWPAEGGADGPARVLSLLSESDAVSTALFGGMEVLGTAAARFGSPTLRVAAERWPAVITTPNKCGQSPLHLSCAYGNIGDALWLLRRGADVLLCDRVPTVTRSAPSAQEADTVVEGPCGTSRRLALYNRGYYPKVFDMGVKVLCADAAKVHRTTRALWRTQVDTQGFGPLQYLTMIGGLRLQACVAGGGAAGEALISGVFAHSPPGFAAECCDRLLMAARSARGVSLPDWEPAPAPQDVDEELAATDPHGTGAGRLPLGWIRALASVSLPIELSTLARAAAAAATHKPGDATDVSAAATVLPGQRGLAAFYASAVAKPKKSLLKLLSRYGGALDELDLGCEYTGPTTLRFVVSELLPRLPKVKRLVLRSCQVVNADVVSLCRSAAAHPALVTVDLSQNPDVYLEGGRALQGLLRQNGRITDVDVAGTGLSEASKAAIAEACAENRRSVERLVRAP